jgi:urease gamma subunit
MVSSSGYEPRALVAFEANKIKTLEVVNNKITVQLNDFVLQGKVLTEIVVIGYHTMGKLDVMGSVLYMHKDTVATKLQRKIGDLARLVTINKPIDNMVNNSGSIKVYPNPAPAGGNFYVQLNVKEAGEYNVQFIDASGRIIAGKQLTIAAPGQVEVFPGAALQGHGMFFVRVAGKKDGKIYSTKLVVE